MLTLLVTPVVYSYFDRPEGMASGPPAQWAAPQTEELPSEPVA